MSEEKTTTEQATTPDPKAESAAALDRAWAEIQTAYDALKTAQLELADGMNWAAAKEPNQGGD